MHAVHLPYYAMVFYSLLASAESLSPYLCFQHHLSVSLLLSLHHSLLIQGSDFLLLVTLFHSPTHSPSIRTRSLIPWMLWTHVSPSLPSSFRNTIKILAFHFFFGCNFLKVFFSFFIFFYLLGLEVYKTRQWHTNFTSLSVLLKK